jgi:uncharacterized protein (DUF4415 family)
MSSDNKSKKELSDELDRLEEEYGRLPDERRIIGRGPEALRAHMRQAAEPKKQLTMRLDADVVARFKELAGPQGSYQTLMNRALHEWLEAHSVGGLLESTIRRLNEVVEQLEGQRVMLLDQDPREGGH